MTQGRIRRVETSTETGSPEKFEGAVELETSYRSPQGPRCARVRFYDGAHTRWHFHLGEQILYFVEGHGWVQQAGEAALECGPGDIVYVPEQTRHAHGARQGTNASHVALTHGETVWEGHSRYNELHGR